MRHRVYAQHSVRFKHDHTVWNQTIGNFIEICRMSHHTPIRTNEVRYVDICGIVCVCVCCVLCVLCVVCCVLCVGVGVVRYCLSLLFVVVVVFCCIVVCVFRFSFSCGCCMFVACCLCLYLFICLVIWSIHTITRERNCIKLDTSNT